MGNDRQFREPPMMASAHRRSRWTEVLIACCALGALLAVEWYLTLVIPGTSYSQTDGKMFQAVIVTAFRFGGIFNLTNLNPVQGFGSLLLPMNVWANPAYWPFTMQDSLLATDLSAALALGYLAVGCYIMARCFDVPVLPSIIAAQLVIILFPPLVRVMVMFYEMLWLNPGTAIAYAAPMVALGILARLNTEYAYRFGGKGLVGIGSVFRNPAARNFIYVTGGVFALLLYGVCCDPFWIVISGTGLIGAFVVVTLVPFGFRPILRRCAVLGCCLALLLATGALVYVYTLSQYTARVWFSKSLYYDPTQTPFFASIVLILPQTLTHYYGACAPGWLLGLVLARGRQRILVYAALGSFLFFVIYAGAYLLSARWWLPLPIYVEEPAMPLFTTAAIVGYWLGLTAAAGVIRHVWRGALAKLSTGLAKTTISWQPSTLLRSCRRLAAGVAALAVAMVVPASAMMSGVSIGANWPPILVPFPDEPELLHYFEDAIGLRVGAEYRGIVSFPSAETTAYNFWLHGVPTANEYSQTFSPLVIYLFSAVFRLPLESGYTNGTAPAIGPEGSYDVLLKTLQALGVRYLVYTKRVPAADQKQFPVTVFPRRPPIAEGGSPSPIPPGDWIVYQLPEPNTGNYSPTKIALARTGAEIAAILRTPDFDFKEQAVLTNGLSTPLIPASAARLSIIRDGLHLKAHSDETSLLILPQQFSECLSARDPRVRLVRADLLMTGVVFSGDIDTDISFDYGVFSPWCRLADISETKSLDLKSEPAPH
jgi:hypothetical protein